MKKINIILIFILIINIVGCTSENDIILQDTEAVNSTKDSSQDDIINNNRTIISIKDTSLDIELYSCQQGVTTEYQVIFNFYFTNNSGKDCAFDDIYIVKLYQSGVECYQNYTPLGLTMDELNNFDKNIRNGYSAPIKIGYNISKLNDLELVILSDGNEIANYYIEINLNNNTYTMFRKKVPINVLDNGLYGYYDNIGGAGEFYFEWMESKNCYKLLFEDEDYEETLTLYNDNTGIWGISSETIMQFQWEIKKNSLHCIMEEGWTAVFQYFESYETERSGILDDKYSNYDYNNSIYQEDSEWLKFSPEMLEEYLSENIYGNIYVNTEGNTITVFYDTINNYNYKILNAQGNFYRVFSINFDFIFNDLPYEIHSAYCDLIQKTITIDGEKYVFYQ